VDNHNEKAVRLPVLPKPAGFKGRIDYLIEGLNRFVNENKKDELPLGPCSKLARTWFATTTT
jgi:hypothetical protein